MRTLSAHRQGITCGHKPYPTCPLAQLQPASPNFGSHWSASPRRRNLLCACLPKFPHHPHSPLDQTTAHLCECPRICHQLSRFHQANPHSHRQTNPVSRRPTTTVKMVSRPADCVRRCRTCVMVRFCNAPGSRRPPTTHRAHRHPPIITTTNIDHHPLRPTT